MAGAFRPWRSFLFVPVVATATWYVLMLATLAAVNGRLRWRTDVLAMGLGAIIVGLPAAAVMTLVVAIPAYALVRRRWRVTLATATVAGGIIGLGAGLIFAAITDERTALSPVRGLIIGLVAASAWWYAAERREGH
jgi:hypothetical protein